ncbi:MAG: DUF817 domain-containing protein [Alphaproteobacteria bacterium]|nr:DUF817 domain-containing protein [Alphaproteobacteria bacterium]MBU1563010.1 DUF817 domain-containing protein [Alphaproteobacteria bacterium]MBU2304205.1 DUF817 domain-containing protein [Alphaproteobacteria bacterium]MBU2368206.1 DUF817 domain-containing protein [Alphaproteobacteria bacterium]
MNQFTSLEARIDALAHLVLQRLPRGRFADGLVEFVVFGLKQAWACLFGGLMLAMILLTGLWWPDLDLARYDAWFIAALLIQAAMLAFRLETLSEAKVILIFHLVGTGMELFKTAAGSWIYPEEAIFRLGGVPLFSGFMYACVGSYMARIQRIFDITFSRYPPVWMTALLALAIYVNFFSHHFFMDFRWLLFAGVALLYWPATMHYRVFRFRHRMPMLLAFVLVALFIWIAENIGTWSRAWIYPDQRDGWSMVSWSKLGSWYLLMLISVVLVTLVHPPRPHLPER